MTFIIDMLFFCDTFFFHSLKTSSIQSHLFLFAEDASFSWSKVKCSNKSDRSDDSKDSKSSKDSIISWSKWSNNSNDSIEVESSFWVDNALIKFYYRDISKISRVLSLIEQESFDWLTFIRSNLFNEVRVFFFASFVSLSDLDSLISMSSSFKYSLILKRTSSVTKFSSRMLAWA
jgi:hypothetical protein